MKKTIRYKRLLPEESLALLRDEDTKKLNWRHRFRAKERGVQRGQNKLSHQGFKDYPHKKFKTLVDFEEFIEAEKENV
jgi:hypothetical protein